MYVVNKVLVKLLRVLFPESYAALILWLLWYFALSEDSHKTTSYTYLCWFNFKWIPH